MGVFTHGAQLGAGRTVSAVTAPADFAYLRQMIREGTVKGPVLEIGSRAWQGAEGNFRRLCDEEHVKWEGADVEPGDGVDFVLDILDDDAVTDVGRTWPTVLVANLLEHVYDPIAALRNALAVTEPGGVCVVVGPAVWQLHDFPRDYWRPMPDFFFEFADRGGHKVVPGSARWLIGDGTLQMETTTVDGQKMLPSSHLPSGRIMWGRSWQWSRVVHRVFDTVGRRTPFPYCGFGVAIRR